MSFLYTLLVRYTRNVEEDDFGFDEEKTEDNGEEEGSKLCLGSVLNNLIEANKKRECVADKSQIDLLSREFEDDEIRTSGIPKQLGMSYRKMLETKKFKEIRVFNPRGRRSKVDVEILKDKIKK